MGTRNKTDSYLVSLILLDIFLMLIGLFILFDFRNNRLVEISELESKIVSLKESKQRAGVVGQMVKDSREARDKLSLYFITKETVANFIAELESVASRSGVVFKLNSLNIVREKEANKPSYLKLNLRVEGDYSEVSHFLNVLENLPYQFRFNAVTLAKLEKEKSSWYGDVDLELVSYIDK